MRSVRRWWFVFGACSVLVVGALLVVSVLVLRLERADLLAQRDAEHQESLRLAMWRMDSWLAPLLAREASRHHLEYEALVPKELAYGRDALPLGPWEVLVPSPLLDFESDLFHLHFRLDESGDLTSPQLPGRGFGGLGTGTHDEKARQERTALLEELRPALDPQSLTQRLAGAEAGSTQPPIGRQAPDEKQTARSRAEYEARIACAVDSAAPVPPGKGRTELAGIGGGVRASVGPLVPLWVEGLDGEAAHELILVRRVLLGTTETYQGALVDWGRLSARLLEQIDDLFPDAGLRPITDPVRPLEATGREMAMLPVALTSADPPPLVVPRLTTVRAALGLGWLATALALGTVGLTLRKSIEFGARRDGFVSSVTHELRTPLTTFRMYTGMLADGMVEEEEKRRSYLRTLRDEATRLSTTVENVLTLSRLERGRSAVGRPETMTVDEMLERVTPPLRRRAEAAGMTLEASADGVGEVEAHIDADLLGQVLSNLVDNACKYAGEAPARTVHLGVEIGDGGLDLRVRDHGPGIAPGRAREIFRPFDRAGRPPTDGTSGVGLGLSISRGLAREMGGELTLEPGSGEGACFRLRLPRATAENATTT